MRMFPSAAQARQVSRTQALQGSAEQTSSSDPCGARRYWIYSAPVRKYSSRMAGAIKGRGALSQPPGRFDKLTKSSSTTAGTKRSRQTSARPPSCPNPRARSSAATTRPTSASASPSIHIRDASMDASTAIGGHTTFSWLTAPRNRSLTCKVGDAIYGTETDGWYRRYVKTRVLAHWSVIKPAWRVTLEDGTTLVAGAGSSLPHRSRLEIRYGITESARISVPHLTVNNKLMGTGGFAAAPEKALDYRLGYLCGVIRGDGLLRVLSLRREGQACPETSPSVSPCALRSRGADAHPGIPAGNATSKPVSSFLPPARNRRRQCTAIRTNARANVEEVRKLVAWPDEPAREWHAGFSGRHL